MTQRGELLDVAVLVDTSTGWGRRLIRGINNYALKTGGWRLWIEPRGRSEKMRLPVDWAGAGVIARLTSQQHARALFSLGCEVVNVSGIEISGIDVPTVMTNLHSNSQLAFNHFHEKGLSSFAYAGPLKKAYAKNQSISFQKIVSKSGNFDFDDHDCVSASMVTKGWLERRKVIAQWIQKLPKPVGIFCWGTGAATQILDVCRTSSFVVPDDVAVLAGDDDELICNMTVPTLSGIMVSSEQIGYEAAKLLDHNIRSETRDLSTKMIDALNVVGRQSTDAFAIVDPELLAAVKFIRSNATQQITVQQVADSVPVSRRSLERKFKDAFGRTPLEEIQRLRMTLVCDLLTNTDLQMPQIARQTGFGTPEYMATAFKSRYGVTPLKFRSKTRAR